jgi:hypothetical protein
MSMKQVQRTLAVEDDFDESKPSRRWPATMRSTEGGVSVARIWPSNQEVSAKGFGRAIKKSRQKDLAEQSRSLGKRIWPSNQEVLAKGFGRAIKKSWRKDLAEQPRSLSDKEVGRATKKSRQKDLAEQPRSLSDKEVGRATKESRRQGSWPSMKRVFGP